MTATSSEQDVRDEVAKVLVRYATGIDSRDWELLRTCFTDDCDADYGDTGHWHGSDEITSWMAQTHDPVGPTLHRISNVAVEAGAGSACARSYVHAIVVMPDRSSTVHAFGWYDDELVPANGGWRISRRRFTTVTTEVHSVVRQ